MRVTLEQVETLRKRVHCDYQTAEKALRKSKGNIDAAVLYLKKRENKKYIKVFEVIKEIMDKMLSYNLLIFKNDKKVFHFPILFVVIVIWSLNIPLPIVISIGVLAALSEFSFEIMDRKEANGSENSFSANNNQDIKNGYKEDAEEIIKKKDSTTSEKKDLKQNKEGAAGQEQEAPQEYDDNDDGFDEIIIE